MQKTSAPRLGFINLATFEFVLALVVGGDGNINVLQGRVGVAQGNDLRNPRRRQK